MEWSVSRAENGVEWAKKSDERSGSLKNDLHF